MEAVEQVVYSILPHGLLQSYLRGVVCVRVVDGRGEERSNLYCSSTHARYLYIKSVTLGGTVQL